ncbi:MAG: cbb3-type cytochrome c oxidase subunit I [Verrucomicrobiales bacterium]
MSSTSSPAEGTKQTIEFNDKVVRQFMIFSIIWGVVAMLAGLVAAFQLNTWRLNFGLEYLTFGRLRPLHTNAAIFAFVGNMMFAGIYYSTQRLCKVRMASDKLSAINMWGWQFIIVCAAATLAARLDPGQRIRRADLADQYPGRRHLGCLRDQLLLDAEDPQRALALRGALVLHLDGHHHRDALHREPPRSRPR